ncbi:hypothetical protein DIPPA_19196 [Diplonema papillatum]|nr:hypothetical protein DIPPA_19186 [Diplonema papillatum]KAJ9465780.1 hypothetical protein DIPPA_19200 [Diplonema papillatum]KAJ9465783.1 hypothetical protein DIPPA_19196 [Diplonema papillatum]
MGEEIPPPVEVVDVQKPAEGDRKWYHHGEQNVTFEEFRETPMGRDILNGDDGEQELEKKWSEMQSEEEHRLAGDHWALQEMANDEIPFSLLNTFEKIEWVVQTFVKVCAVFGVLYLFIIALGLMGNAFKILGGRSSGRTFRDSDLIANPVAGLAIGILATVLMQSSSTTTSIVISMAASDLVTVENASYLVMGANIGTSVTNTIVSIAHLNSPAEYRRAFTGAVFHDMFNWLTVGIFLPLEVASGFLKELAGAAVDSLDLSNDKREKTEFIKKITKPAEGRVVSVDSKLIEQIAAATTSAKVKELEKKSIIKMSSGHVFRESPISDEAAGALLLFISLTMLTTCLLMLVKLLGSVLKGRVAVWTRYLLNIDFKHPVLRSCGGWDNYILLLFGTGVTILVQSSSVFTSTLTPLVGIGLIHIEKMVPLTHGANIGTTVTGVLSALSGSNLDVGLRVALEHVFFNCLGTAVWFVVWPLRAPPLNMAKFMGETAANLRWFPLAYILTGFVALPGLVVGLSVAGWEVLVAVGVPLLLMLLAFVFVVWMRRSRADLLPRQGALSVLRAENAPCGCRLPNFMQLWGGNIDVDRVNIAELQQMEREKARKANSVSEWHYSPVAWGLTFLAFFGVLLAVNTAQWRRVRYGIEPAALQRKEIGLGLTEMCSPQYESTREWATPPPECDLAAVKLCARELSRSCREDPAWATGAATSNEEEQYASAWARCSEHVGCRGYDWTRMCAELPDCQGRSNHEANCWNTMSGVDWFFLRNSEAHGVTVTYDYSGVTTRENLTLPHDNHFASAAAGKATANVHVTEGMPAVDQAKPSLGGIGFDACTGDAFVITTRGPTTACAGGVVFTDADYAISYSDAHLVRNVKRSESAFSVVFALEDDATEKWTALDGTTGLPNVAHNTGADCAGGTVQPAARNGIAPGGIRKMGAGVFVTADKYGSRLVLFQADGTVLKSLVPSNSGYTAANTGAPVDEVLPENFYEEGIDNGIGAMAVKHDGTKVVACMRKPLAGTRLVRCAIVNYDSTTTTATLAGVKLVVLSDVKLNDGADGMHNEVQGQLEIAAASWLSGDKVLLLERDSGRTDSFKGSSLYEVDFATGSEVANLTVAALESALDENVPYLALSLQALAARPVAPATMTLRATSDDLGEQVEVPVVDIFVGSEATVVMVEDKAWGQDKPSAILAVDLATTLPYEAEANCDAGKLEPVTPAMVGVLHETKCHDINDICIEGDLAGDMKAVRGLAICATLFMGLSLPLIIVYCFLPYHGVVKFFIFAAAATLTLSWIFSLASWAHMSSLTQNEYGCIFVDESLRGGLIVQRGKLQWLTRDSYSWGFMIYAWGMITIPLVCVIHRVIRVTCLPYSPRFAVEPDEDVLDGMPATGKNEPVA